MMNNESRNKVCCFQRSAAGELVQKIDLPWKKKRLLLGAECSLPSLLIIFQLAAVNLNVALFLFAFCRSTFSTGR